MRLAGWGAQRPGVSAAQLAVVGAGLHTAAGDALRELWAAAMQLAGAGALLAGTGAQRWTATCAALRAAVYSGLFAELTSNELKRESIP